MAKVLVKLNESNDVIAIGSDLFIEDTENWIPIDEGEGDKYAHAFNYYLKKGLIDDQGRYNYKYIANEVVEIPESEKETPRSETTTGEPSIEERLDAIDSAIAELAELVGGTE